MAHNSVMIHSTVSLARALTAISEKAVLLVTVSQMASATSLRNYCTALPSEAVEMLNNEGTAILTMPSLATARRVFDAVVLTAGENCGLHLEAVLLHRCEVVAQHNPPGSEVSLAAGPIYANLPETT